VRGDPGAPLKFKNIQKYSKIYYIYYIYYITGEKKYD